MARLVTHTAHGPSTVKIGEKSILICRCGLSKNDKGQCDGSHMKTLDEEKDTMYVYREDGSRYLIEEDEPCDCGEDCDCQE